MADNLKGIPFSTDDEGVDYIAQAKMLVWSTYNQDQVEGIPIEMNEIYVVSFTYVLGNWKAMVSTSRTDGRYYEVTFKRENDGSDGPARAFVDTYVKVANREFAIDKEQI